MLKPNWAIKGALRSEGMIQYKLAVDTFVENVNNFPDLDKEIAKFTLEFFTKGQMPSNHRPA